jgi:hypothetical protein
MNYRRWSRVAEWSVLAAVLGTHAAVMLLPFAFSEPPALLEDAQNLAPMCMLTLVVAWAIVGPGRWWLRVLVVPPLVVGAGLIVGQYFVPEQDAPAFIGGLTAGSATGLLAVRLRGIRMVRLLPGGPAEPRPQFSILSLLVATTLIGFAIGGLEFLRPWMAVEQTSIDPWVIDDTLLGPASADPWISAGTIRVLVLSTFVAGIAVAAMLMMTRPGAAWLRLALLLIAIPTLSIYLLHLIGITSESLLLRTSELAIGFSMVAGLTALTVLPLRLFGYRLMRPAARAEPANCRPPATAAAALAPSMETIL